MGKIFDALEKASIQLSGKGSLNGDKSNETIRQPEKVVRIANSGKTSAGELNIDKNLIAFQAPTKLESEFFKVLRTNLLFPSVGKPPRKVLVTSALPGDGKSFVTANLAISMAQGLEDRVLLIDCDVRKPSIHKLFGFRQVSGLSEYLSKGIDLPEILLKSTMSSLTILPAGTPPPNPTELLISKRMKALVDEVAGRYDDRFILIDSPPPSMASETSALANMVDGVILVVKAGKTPQGAVSDTIEQIGKEKILGVVMNFAHQKVKKYYGYEKSAYYMQDRN